MTTRASSATKASSPAPTPSRRSTRSSRKRASEVLEAAAAVFAQRGYHGATTLDIASRLGIRQASLYYYFASKEDALEAICQHGVEGFIDQATSAARAPGTSCERLAQVITRHLQAIAEKHDFVRVFLNERQYLSDPARRRIGRLSARYEAIIQGIFEGGVASREFRVDLDCRLATLSLLALCNSAAAWYGREPGFDIQTIAAHFSTLLCGGLARDRTCAPAAPTSRRGRRVA